MEIGRITILADSPSPAAGGRCQTVSYMISGNTEQHRTISSSALLYLYLWLCLHRDSGQQRALGLCLGLPSQRNLMLSVIVGLLLRVCREEGNVSAEVSHRTAQARRYSQRCPTRWTISTASVVPHAAFRARTKREFTASVVLHVCCFYR